MARGAHWRSPINVRLQSMIERQMERPRPRPLGLVVWKAKSPPPAPPRPRTPADRVHQASSPRPPNVCESLGNQSCRSAFANSQRQASAAPVIPTCRRRMPSTQNRFICSGGYPKRRSPPPVWRGSYGPRTFNASIAGSSPIWNGRFTSTPAVRHKDQAPSEASRSLAFFRHNRSPLSACYNLTPGRVRAASIVAMPLGLKGRARSFRKP